MKERKVGGRSYDVPNLASLCKSYFGLDMAPPTGLEPATLRVKV